MATSIETMLENLEELLEDSMSVPLSGGKHVVDVDAARDIIDDIRLNMPQETVQARAIVRDRARIISKAKREAEDIVKNAEERARNLIKREEIVRQAEAKAKTIIYEANQQALQIKGTVIKYCDDVLSSAQDQMQKTFSEIKVIRDGLKK